MPMKDDVQVLMTGDVAGAKLITFARDTAARLVKDQLKRTQIRNIFTEVRQIEAKWPAAEAVRRLAMLKPKLAYQAARSKEVGFLRDVLSEAVDGVINASNEADRDRRFQRFMELFEAILAYHRAEGGQN